MSTEYLGPKFDIHGGGMDLKFPHHESEIAQGKACTTSSDPTVVTSSATDGETDPVDDTGGDTGHIPPKPPKP